MDEKCGVITMLIIRLLSERPLSGYDIIKRAEGVLGRKPSSGTIYPALKNLERAGLIVGLKEGRKTVYHMTEQGERHFRKLMDLREEYLRWYEGMRRAFGEIFSGPAGDERNIWFALDLLAPLKNIIIQLKDLGVDEREIRKVLDETRTKLLELKQ